MLAACGAASSPPAVASRTPDDAAVVADFQGHRSNVEVTADGTIIRLLPDRSSSTGMHEQFIIRLSAQDLTIEVEHNFSIAPRVPAQVGDHVIVHGEYIWNSKGGLIHFTHHDPQGTHEGGYVVDQGKTYG
ncbi:MAG TPA: DUF3465 domain-containing protein [Candidatus Dormibacteraeota bacterium]|nr:DUF3465 domain-containing protein [Candidatus Dormibacteraeota bacterium]